MDYSDGEEWKKGYNNENNYPIKCNWDGYQHVYPLNDLIAHKTDAITDQNIDIKTYPCPCNPKIDFENRIIIHSAMDRREVFEKE